MRNTEQMCEICGEHPAEYSCDQCGRLICQNCWNSSGLCDECQDLNDYAYEQTYGPFAP
jgi:hypothetical protein